MFNPVTVPIGIDVKYHSEGMTPLEKTKKGDWIDLRAGKKYVLKKDDYGVLDLGVSMKLPEGYEAIVAARSSLFRKHGILVTNGIGIIDNSYCGDDDVWGLCYLATRDTVIEFDERIAQFRILPTMEQLGKEREMSYFFNTVDKLDGENRGGFGSTGSN